MIEKLETPSNEEACLRGAVLSRLYWCGDTEILWAKGQGLQAAQRRLSAPSKMKAHRLAAMIQKHVLLVDDKPDLLDLMSMRRVSCLGWQAQDSRYGSRFAVIPGFRFQPEACCLLPVACCLVHIRLTR